MQFKRLRRYSGLIAIIATVMVFVTSMLLVNLYFRTTVVHADIAGVSKSSNWQVVLELNKEPDKQLRDRVLAHVKLIRDGGEVATKFGFVHQFEKQNDPILIEAADTVEKVLLDESSGSIMEAYANFMQAHRNHVLQRSQRYRIMQYSAAGLAILGFLAILFLVFFRLGRIDRQFETQRANNQTILDTIPLGLFMVGEDLLIRPEQSRVVKELFERSKPLEGSLLDLLRPLVTAEDLDAIQQYVASLLHLTGAVVQASRPSALDQIQVIPPRAENSSVERFLHLDFAPSKSVGDRSLLVSVSDITTQIALQKELLAVSETSNERFQVLMGNIAADSEDLNEFYSSAFGQLNQINELVREEMGDRIGNEKKLVWIEQKVIKMRDQAGAIGVTLIESSAAQMQEKIERLKAKSELHSDDLFALTVDIAQINKELEFLQDLTTSFESNDELQQQELETQSARVTRSLQQHSVEQIDKLKNFATRLAKRKNKNVNVEIYGFSELPMKPSEAQELNAVCTQLIRNAVVHGVEDSDTRAGLNKPSAGQIILALREHDQETLQLTVRDDGAGLDLKKILTRAVSEGLIDENDAADLDATRIVRFIFKPGFSASDAASGEASSGYGLDIVKTSVAGMGGSIGVKSRRGLFTQVSISLPKSVLAGRV